MEKYECLDHPDVGQLDCENCYLEVQAGKIENESDARQFAIDWQNWAGEQSLSYGELAEYGAYFQELADQFELVEEFQENGII